jgi:small conductance mechanosensitive channel
MSASALKLENIINSLGTIAIQHSLKLLSAIVIFTVGMWLANRLTKSAKRIMQARDLEPSLQTFFGSFVGIVLKILVVVIVLTTAGVQMTSIVAILGAASLAIGMALSGTLQNFAGGIVILIFKPFQVGDEVQTSTGKTGTIAKIMIFTTEMHTADEQVIYLPNGPLSNSEIINLSRQKNRRIDIVVGIAYGDDTDVARKVVLDILAKDNRVLQKPAPAVFVKNLSDNSVDLNIRFWTRYSDYYTTQPDVKELIYKTFPKKKLHFPFPQMDVHIGK